MIITLFIYIYLSAKVILGTFLDYFFPNNLIALQNNLNSFKYLLKNL